MAVKKLVLLVCNTGCDFPVKALERRIAIAKRRHPQAEVIIRNDYVVKCQNQPLAIIPTAQVRVILRK